jgi:hypothetical protein
MSNAGARLLYVSSRASMMNYRSYLGTIKVPVRESKLESATKHDYIGLRNPTHCGFSTVWLLSQIAWNQLQRQPWQDRQARGSLRGRHNKYQRLHGCLLQHGRPQPHYHILLEYCGFGLGHNKVINGTKRHMYLHFKVWHIIQSQMNG